MLKIIVYCCLLSFIWCVQASDEEFVHLDILPVNCSQELTKAAGSFKPKESTLKEKMCVWHIKPNKPVNGTQPMHIHLLLEELFLHNEDVILLYRSLDDVQKGTSPLLKEPIRAQNGSVTVTTEEEEVVVVLKGNDTLFVRKFLGYYISPGCNILLGPDLQIIHSPIPTINMTAKSSDCTYIYNYGNHHRIMPVFLFEEFSFKSSSSVTVKGSTEDGTYTSGNIMNSDFFPNSGATTVEIEAKMDFDSGDYFVLKMHMVDNACSGERIGELTAIQSPNYELNNGSIVNECRWVLKTHSKVLGVTFDSLVMNNVFDLLVINDGPSERSLPLLQVTQTNSNITKMQTVRSTGNTMWISFKPVTYASVFKAHVTKYDQGGYFKNEGALTMAASQSAYFLLEVDDDKVVVLNFTQSSFSPPATLNLYDGFDNRTLLASLHGNVWYPVLSKSSRMMLEAKDFQSGSFNAKFHGEKPSCNLMSYLSTGSYVLIEHCNTTCTWVIPPQDTPDSKMMLNLQYLSLKEGDQIEIYRLDNSKTTVGTISSGVKHVPLVAVPSNVGALVKVTQKSCKKETQNIVLVGHTSYIPECGGELNPAVSETFQLLSPRYPDTYPVLDKCLWNITVGEKNLLHLEFSTLKLAENHCIKVTSIVDKKSTEYYGDKLPDDMFLKGGTVVEFDSTGCKKEPGLKSMVSSEGFVINGTVADCGSILDGKKSGEFNTSIGNKSLCMWKVVVPPTDGDSVNIISYTMTKKDQDENYELHVYDGSSVREPEIKNSSSADIWSRTNSLIFVYKHLNTSKASSVLIFKYSTVSCNSSMQCKNKLCLHPDWRCNGVNDCGDFTDEESCQSIPIPPKPADERGYSKVAFWSAVVCMFLLGSALAFIIPYSYQRFKNGQYRRFGDISVIE